MTNAQKNAPTVLPSTAPHAEPDRVGPRWPAWVRVVAAVGVIFGLLVATSLLTAPLVGLLPDTVATSVALRVGQHLVFFLLVIAAFTVLVRKVDRRHPAEIGLRITRWSLPFLILGVGVSTFAQVIAAPLAGLLGELRLMPPPTMDVPVLLVVLLVVSQAFLLQGLPEELVFRGYILVTLSARPWVAIGTSVGAFTALHLLSSGGQQGLVERLLYLAMPLGFAVSATGLALLLKSLWAAVGIHAGFHWATMVGASQGMGDGPALWITLGAVHLAIGVITLVRWQRINGTITYTR